MYLKEKRRWRPDSFSHEQSLVFDTPDGLVIFNSCSHGGADTIIREVTATFPDKKVKAWHRKRCQAFTFQFEIVSLCSTSF